MHRNTSLPNRVKQILQLSAQGLDKFQISAVMFIQPGSVEVMKSVARREFHVTTTKEAVEMAIQANLISQPTTSLFTNGISMPLTDSRALVSDDSRTLVHK